MVKCSRSIEISKRSIPISIPNKHPKQKIYCELSRNLFNPDKLSPPNSWNSRLLDRFYGSSKKTYLD